MMRSTGTSSVHRIRQRTKYSRGHCGPHPVYLPRLSMSTSRWAFLRPSLAPLRGCLGLVPRSVGRVGVGRHDQLVSVRKMKSRKPQALREAIVLLAMVARVDPDGAKLVMTDFCGLKVDDVRGVEDESFWPLRFSLAISATCRVGWTAADIAAFFPAPDDPPSNNFIALARKITATRKGKAGRRELVTVAVFVNVKIESYGPANVAALLRGLLSIREKNHGRRFPLAASSPPGDSPLFPCELSFEGLQLDLSESMLSIEDTEAIKQVMGEDCPLPVDVLAIAPHIDDRIVHDNIAAAQFVGGLYQSILCASGGMSKLPTINRLQVNLEFDILSPLGRLASILSEARTSSKVELKFGMNGRNPRFWEYIAYAFFTKQAATNSAVSSVSLLSADLDLDCVEAFAAVLASPDPATHVFGGGSSTNSSTPCIHRRMKLMRGTHILLEPMEGNEYTRNLKLHSDVHGVRLLDDTLDGACKVLIPGFGVCTVHRAQILSLDDNIDGQTEVPVTSLHLDLCVHDGGEPLYRMLDIIGYKLTQLRLDGELSNNLDIKRLFQCCPNLKVLTLNSIPVDTHEFLIALQEENMQISELQCRFNNVFSLLNELSEKKSKLACNLKRLVYEAQYDSFEDKMAILDSFAAMLDMNCSVEYIEIEDPSLSQQPMHTLEKHHLVPLPVANQPFPLQGRLAFLSIFQLYPDFKHAKASSDTLAYQALDQEVLSIIFDFAAERVRRHVYYRM